MEGFRRIGPSHEFGFDRFERHASVSVLFVGAKPDDRPVKHMIPKRVLDFLPERLLNH
jgi:hypothetical protein